MIMFCKSYSTKSNNNNNNNDNNNNNFVHHSSHITSRFLSRSYGQITIQLVSRYFLQ